MVENLKANQNGHTDSMSSSNSRPTEQTSTRSLQLIRRRHMTMSCNLLSSFDDHVSNDDDILHIVRQHIEVTYSQKRVNE